MITLALQQQTLLGALLLRPGSLAARDAQAQLEGLVLSPSSRGLAAYRANGQALAERALAAAYPVVAAMVGPACLNALARTLWHGHPSRHGDVARWGGDLPALLALEAQLADFPYLADLARVEWALHLAAGAPDDSAEPASFALLTQQDPGALTLRLAPGTAVIRSAWPVASLVNAHLRGEPTLSEAADRLRDREAEQALVWRRALRAEVRPCEAGEAALVDTLLHRQGLVPALDAALATDPGFDFSAWLAQAVGDGLVLGACPHDHHATAIHP